MKSYLQPITARVNAGTKKSCGCSTPAKMKSKEDKSSNKESKFMEIAEMNQESAMKKLKSKEDKPSNKEGKFMERAEMNQESAMKKMKDLSGDGKITLKDVLIGRGVIKSPSKMCGKKH